MNKRLGLTAAIAASMAVTGCATSNPYGYNDPYYNNGYNNNEQARRAAIRAEEVRLEKVTSRKPNTRLSCQIQVREDLTVRVLRRLSENPELGDSGPRPIEWPAEHPLPPED